MEFEKQKILEEKIDHDFEGTYDFVTSNKKCGDIFIQTNEKFYIVCAFCIIRFTEFEEFTTHYAKKHYDNSTNPLDIIKNEDDDNDVQSEVNLVSYNGNDNETSDGYIQENYCIDDTGIESTTTVFIEKNLVEESVNVDKKNVYSSKRNQKNISHTTFFYKCDTCEKTFTSEIKLKEHKMYDHLLFDPFIELRNANNQLNTLDCELEDDGQINIQSTQEQPQLINMNIEIDHRKCRYCHRKFKSKNLKIQHERIHTGERPFKCKTCHKCFSNSNYYKIHEVLHTGIKPFKCDLCDASFPLKYNLKKHILRHKGVKTYSCSYCEKKFVDNPSKRIHERVHTGERPYQCPNCGKCFITSSALFQHRKSHHSNVVEKPYKCKICNKCFTRSYTLKSHSATHSDLRPFSCKICNKTFKLPERLRSHSNIHSDVPKYTCNICGKGFKQSAVFGSHMKSHGVISMK